MVGRRHICLVSGGTGGHLWPALSLAERLRDAGHGTSLVTEGRAVEKSLLDRAGCDAITLPVARGSNRLQRVAGLPGAVLGARRMLRERGVDAVIGTGGGASVAVGLAARSLRLPLCLMEQNAVVGRANRLLGPFARRVYLGLPLDRGPAPRPDAKLRLTGTPVRQEFGCVDRAAARARLNLRDDAPVVFVTGGSQGAAVLNDIVPQAICALRRPIQVVHLSGDGNDGVVRPRYVEGMDHGVEAVVRPLALDMPDLFAAADLVICRGGGCTVSELVATGRPAVIVPYPHHADRQQLRNARILERAGAAEVVEQSALSVETLTERLARLLGDPAALAAMGQCAAGVAPRDSADQIVGDLEGMFGA